MHYLVGGQIQAKSRGPTENISILFLFVRLPLHSGARKTYKYFLALKLEKLICKINCMRLLCMKSMHHRDRNWIFVFIIASKNKPCKNIFPYKQMFLCLEACKILKKYMKVVASRSTEKNLHM